MTHVFEMFRFLVRRRDVDPTCRDDRLWPCAAVTSVVDTDVKLQCSIDQSFYKKIRKQRKPQGVPLRDISAVPQVLMLTQFPLLIAGTRLTR